jgi:GTP-binding protein EngB required for normal cell division
MYEEYLVFTGRPNAGKSSIIREVVGINVATGKHPGTTRRISKYALSGGLSLVDMPGFGRIMGVSKPLENMRKNRIIRFLKHSPGRPCSRHIHLLGGDVALGEEGVDLPGCGDGAVLGGNPG